MAAHVDTSELDALADDLQRAAASLLDRARPVMSKAGLEVKRRLAEDMAASPSFRGISGSISYDTRQDRLGILVEVGPDRRRHGGALANIAYFGSPSQPGGASVPDPLLAAEAELPALEKYLGDLLEHL